MKSSLIRGTNSLAHVLTSAQSTMPRYTSVQTFSDQNTKVVKLGESSVSSSSSSSEAHEKVWNVRSSNAGAGSSAFHVYRQARSREMNRIGLQEEEEKKQKEREELASKVDANRREADEKTRKNAEKRKKRKLAAQQRVGATKQLKSVDDAEETAKSVDDSKEAAKDES